MEVDAAVTNRLIVAATAFGHDFVKPGGTFVCKAFHSSNSPLLEKSLRSVFASLAKYKPMHSRKGSPVMYYVLKGFMLSETFIISSRFRKELLASRNKAATVKKFQQFRTSAFDPEKLITK